MWPSQKVWFDDPLVFLVFLLLPTLYQNKHERPSPYRQSGLPCTISATALPAGFTPFVFVHGPVGICTRQRIRKAYHTLFTLVVTCKQGHVLKKLFKWMKKMGASLGWFGLASNPWKVLTLSRDLCIRLRFPSWICYWPSNQKAKFWIGFYHCF